MNKRDLQEHKWIDRTQSNNKTILIRIKSNKILYVLEDKIFNRNNIYSKFQFLQLFFFSAYGKLD